MHFIVLIFLGDSYFHRYLLRIQSTISRQPTGRIHPKGSRHAAPYDECWCCWLLDDEMKQAPEMLNSNQPSKPYLLILWRGSYNTDAYMNHIILMSFCKDPNPSTTMVLNTYHFLNKPNAAGFIQMPHHFKINVFFNYFNYLLLFKPWNYPFHPCIVSTSWWFEPIWKICSSKWESSPIFGIHKKYLEPPPSHLEPPSYWYGSNPLFVNYFLNISIFTSDFSPRRFCRHKTFATLASESCSGRSSHFANLAKLFTCAAWRHDIIT